MRVVWMSIGKVLETEVPESVYVIMVLPSISIVAALSAIASIRACERIRKHPVA
jgi:hypothetical protein